MVGRYAEDEGVRPGMAVDLGDALMGLGRPVLVVPAGIEHLEARRIVVGWKNTPQTRRALSDALPLLRRAEEVQVLRVTDAEDRAEVEDVVRYLTLHDVNASVSVAVRSGWSVAEDLQKAVRAIEGDLIVTGGYGYSRLREWFFGRGHARPAEQDDRLLPDVPLRRSRQSGPPGPIVARVCSRSMTSPSNG